MNNYVTPSRMPDRFDSTPSRSKSATCFDEGNFLLADHSQDGAVLLRRAFKEAGIAKPLQVVPTGEEAIGYLRGDGIYSNRTEYPMPNVVLLDLNLHRKSGFEVLGWIRTQPALKSLVVILLTASNRSADADRAHDLGANFYLTKPGSFDQLVGLSRCLCTWLEANHFS